MSEHIFSYGGGVQSTACLVLAARGEIPYKHFIFSNVGDLAENPATIEYMEKISTPYAEQHGINLITVQAVWRNGGLKDLYEDTVRPQYKSVRIPLRCEGSGAPGRRGCTENFKVKPIAKFCKKNPNFTHIGLGISTDEACRAKFGTTDYGLERDYPLLWLGLSRADCEDIIKDAGLPPCPKSACWFCPYRSVSEWQRLADEDPAMLKRIGDLERQLHAKFQSFGRPKRYFSQRGAKAGLCVDEIFKPNLKHTETDEDRRDGLLRCESGLCGT